MSDREMEERLARALEEARLTRRALIRRGAVFGAGLTAVPGLLAACGGDDGGDGGGGNGAGAAQPPASGADISLDELIAAAKEEDGLNTTALPPDWANYGEVMETFQSKYDIRITNATPNASSAEELEQVKSLKGQSRAPDVLDVGPSFALQGKEEGLFAQYQVSTWDTVPDTLKDPDGYWIGDYWGVIAFGANTDVVSNPPQSWQDLLKPEYRGQVALNGDPRESGSAFAGVFCASLANGGSLDDITPGIDFFAELRKAGNFIAVDATPGSVAQGETPITVDWDYLQIAYGDEFEGQISWEVIVPSDGVFGNHYCQAINVDAPHPFAARLWQEFLYSDEGQLLWLKGYSHPARFQDMSDRGVIPQELLDALPPAVGYSLVLSPSTEQSAPATAILAEQWGPKVTGA
jgi:putative spermidine/putrescine transport system substrate-binding protein